MKERIEQAMRSAGMSMPVQEVKPADPFSDFSDEPAASPFSEFDDHENAPPDSYSDPFSDSDVNDNKEEWSNVKALLRALFVRKQFCVLIPLNST